MYDHTAAADRIDLIEDRATVRRTRYADAGPRTARLARRATRHAVRAQLRWMTD
jgi:hypothetical protein